MAKLFDTQSLHGMIITYNDIKKLPSRNAFLEKEIYNETSENITNGRQLLFMPNAIHEMALQDIKYGPSEYKIVLFGAFIDGRRAVIVISGIKPYFEVMIPANDINDESSIGLSLYNKLKNNTDTRPVSFEILKGKQFKGYNRERKTFARFYFDKLKTRKEAINFIRDKKYETTADDASCYYRVVCRDYLTTFSSWVNITDYKVRTYTNIRGSVYEVNINNYKKCDDDITTNIRLARDNIMSMCWDIETYSPDGDLPRPENLEHKMFMIGTTFQWYHSNEQILRVCLVEHPCDARPNYLTIVCDDEKKLIKAFGKLVFKMKPDLNLGFNDSDYDWPWLIKRAKFYPGTLSFIAECFDSTINWKKYDDSGVFNYNYKLEKVKLEADSYAEGFSLVFPGYINIDVRTIFRQLYPTAEKSNLNFYLEINKLSGKKDMPYTELFRIYRELSITMTRRNTIEKLLLDVMDSKYIEIINNYDNGLIFSELKDKMAEVADYCIIDSQRCHELMKIRSVIMDRREVSKLSYTSVFDSFYRANGMKVRNLVIARGQSYGIKFSNISNGDDAEEGKYPGAYVFPPKKGLVVSKITIQERCDNSLIMPNYSEWNKISDQELKEYQEIILEHGACLSINQIDCIKTDRNNKNKIPMRKCFIDFLLELTGRPITGLDFSSLYPSLIMTYNLSPEYIITNMADAKKAHAEGHNLHKIKFMFNGRWIRGWSIRHDNKLDPNSPDYKFGIYPMILKELFDARNKIKAGLHKYKSIKEQIDTLSIKDFNESEKKLEYETVCFNLDYLDSKQKALKVFMNTFYGETGNKRSSFFVIQLAGAITTSGQDNIKMVQRRVEDYGCNVYYGDTDSIYSAMPEKYFIELDKKYFTGLINKEEYWTKQVKITFGEIEKLKNNVNKMLSEDNGTEFLNMAYEEALYPVAFLAKKKYYGIPHISVPNFQPKDLFIKGLDVMKRGVSQLLRKVCMDIMWDSVNMANLYNLKELVQKKIDYIYNTDWDFDDFIRTDIYKPNKNNVKVHTFVKRMEIENITVKPFERFNYVIVKKNPFKYDSRGRKHELLIGEKMEYDFRAKEQNMTIDLDYYMKGSINGQLARLITYDDTFHVNPDSDSIDDLKTAEEKTYNNSCKYIESYCSKYYANYCNKGKIYQKIFRISNNIVIDRIKEYCGHEMSTIFNNIYDIENLETWLETKAEKESMKCNKNYGKIYVDKSIENMNKVNKKIKLKQLQEMYYAKKLCNFSIIRENTFNERKELLQRQVRDNINNLCLLLNYHSGMINTIQSKIKAVLNIDSLYNESNSVIPTFDSMTKNNNINIIELDDNAKNEMEELMDNSGLLDSLNKLRYIYINMVSNYNFIQKTRLIIEYLIVCRDNSIGLVHKPKDFNVKEHIKNNVDDIMREFMS